MHQNMCSTFDQYEKNMAATSRCFVATLPDELTDEQFEKLHAWSKHHCERSDFVKDSKHGCVRLLVMKKEQRTQRDFQRCLRTNLLNYGVALPAKQVGWLKTFDEHDYDRMKMLASGGTAEDTTQSEESSASSSAPRSDPPSPPTPHKDQFSPLLRMPANLLTVK